MGCWRARPSAFTFLKAAISSYVTPIHAVAVRHLCVKGGDRHIEEDGTPPFGKCKLDPKGHFLTSRNKHIHGLASVAMLF
jgi:hypothetical protein